MTIEVRNKKTNELKKVVDIDTTSLTGKVIYAFTAIGFFTVTKKVISIFTKKPQIDTTKESN